VTILRVQSRRAGVGAGAVATRPLEAAKAKSVRRRISCVASRIG
jgi:hypothetical protein